MSYNRHIFNYINNFKTFFQSSCTILPLSPGGSDGKMSACNAGDPGSIPELGRSPGEGNGNPLQYSCLENSMDGEAWKATVHGVAKSRTRLSDLTFFLSLHHFIFLLTVNEIYSCFIFLPTLCIVVAI